MPVTGRLRVPAAGLREAVVLQPLAERAVGVGVVAEGEAAVLGSPAAAPSTAVTAIGTTSVAHSRGAPRGPQHVEAAAPPGERERHELERRDERHQVARREADAGERHAQQREHGGADDQRAPRRRPGRSGGRGPPPKAPTNEPPGERATRGRSRRPAAARRVRSRRRSPSRGVVGITSSGGAGCAAGRSRTNRKSSSGLSQASCRPARREPLAQRPRRRPRRPCG